MQPANALTYLAVLSAASGAIASAVFGNVAAGGAAIGLSVVADTFDGRFARRFARTPFEQRFGVQLDSLADVISSGFVPVVVMAGSLRGTAGMVSAAWAVAAACYIIAAMTRLGYYNLTESGTPHFVGLPAPLASLVVATALLGRPGAVVGAGVLAGCAVLMVSSLRIPRPRGPLLGVFALWALTVCVLHGLAALS